MLKHERDAIKSAKRLGFSNVGSCYSRSTHITVLMEYNGDEYSIIIPASPKNRDDSISATRRRLGKIMKKIRKRRAE